MAERKRLLLVTDSPVLTTGLGRICKEISTFMCNHFDVAVAGWHHLPLRSPFRFHIYPLQKGQQDEFSQMQVVFADFRPEIVLVIGDLWDFQYFPRILSEYKDSGNIIKSILWVTIGGEYLEESWGDIVRSFDTVIPFTNYGISELKKYDKNKEFPVVYPGVDHKAFYPYPDDYKWGKDNIIDIEKVFMVLSVGQNCDRKNLPATLEIFSEFKKDKPDTTLLMVTNARETYGYDLWQIIKRLNLGQQCNITKNTNPRAGISDQKLNLLYNMSVVLLNTAIGEGVGMPLLEAQAAGCVPIATDYAATTEVIQDRGKLVKPAAIIYGQFGIKRAVISQPEAVSALNQLYADWKGDKSLIKAYKQKAKEFIKNLTWNATAEKLLDYIKITETKKKRDWVKNKVQVKDMKLLFVVPSWGKNCGIAEYSKELIQEIEKNDQKVSIFPDNNLDTLVASVKKDKYNVIVFQHEYVFFQDRFLLERGLDELKKEGAKLILEMHTYSPVKIYNNMLIDKFDEIILHCDLFKNSIIGDKNVTNVNVINMGCKKPVDYDLLEFKDSLGIAGKHPVIGSFGFMRDQKGYKEIVKAIEELIPEYPDIKLLLIAPKHEFGSESYVEAFYKYIESLGMEDRVIIIREFMDEEKLLKTLSCVDMFVLNYKSSRAGGGNSAAIKTLMRVQRAIAVSDTFYFADLSKEVYRMKSTITEDIKEAIRYLYNKPMVRKQYIDRANVYLSENLWENVVQQHLDIYSG